MSTSGEVHASAAPARRQPTQVLDELVVLSHLRWVFVWQRPQHLISRLARGRPTWFVEEPLAVAGLHQPVLRTERHADVVRVWLEVPGPERHVSFSDPAASCYPQLLGELLGTGGDRGVWLYTPMALPLAQSLGARVMIYDVMDDLASFRGAPAELTLRQRHCLRAADVVFTGGHSLHETTLRRRPDAHCFPSGVDASHYAPATLPSAAAGRGGDGRQVAGYVGVIDERLDLDLIASLAAALPDWEIRMVGPVLKIDPESLPRAANISYPGSARYADLPAVMGGFDVALMPFALNEATRSISPTKTLEYLAAGLPVISTRVPDVVRTFAELVELQDDGAGFASACVRVVDHCPAERAGRAQPLLNWHAWDTIAERMEAIIAEASVGADPVSPDPA